MVHGYHVILPTYGFWLPNDPRGSWSDAVRRWELLKFGGATNSCERRSMDELTPREIESRENARRRLRYPPVVLNGRQALSIGRAIGDFAKRNSYAIWACAILPEHTHMVIGRHRYAVERMVNLLKGTATGRLNKEGLHPLAKFALPGKRPPRMWAEHEWRVFLDSEEAILNAIRYVEANPEKEGKPRQHWNFVQPFEGIPDSGWVTYL